MPDRRGRLRESLQGARQKQQARRSQIHQVRERGGGNPLERAPRDLPAEDPQGPPQHRSPPRGDLQAQGADAKNSVRLLLARPQEVHHQQGLQNR